MMTTVDQVGPALPHGAAGCTDWQPDGDECRVPLEMAVRMALTWASPYRSALSLAFVSQ